MTVQYVSDGQNLEWTKPSGFYGVLELQWLLDNQPGPNAHVLDIQPQGEKNLLYRRPTSEWTI